MKSKRAPRSSKAGPSHKRPTDAGFRQIASKFKLLGDPGRLKIVYLLQAGPRSVTEVAEELGCPQPTASRQLAQLQAGGVLARRQEGTTVYYSVADPQILVLCDAVCGSMEREQAQGRPPLFHD